MPLHAAGAVSFVGMARGFARATAFVGRRKELLALRRLLSQTRLVTLVGAGGAGKTRLATELAASLATKFADGAILVDLITVADGALIPDEIASAAGITVPGHDRVGALTDQLRDRSALLIIDNCEHLLEPCANVVSHLLRHCASMTIVTTSRERLNIEGETVWSVPPLSLPRNDDVAVVDASDAVRLFVDRAQLVQPAFSVDAGNAADVAAICRAVDGIPLALELAAARLVTASPAELRVLLADRLGTLVGGGRDVAARQRTMRATIAWSYDLLTGAQRVLFRRLAVFVGGQLIDAIREVCAFSPLAHATIHVAITELVEKSVLWVRHEGDVTRFGMLQPIREYALERLHASGEHPTLAARHRALYARLAAEAWDAHRWGGARAELRRLSTEIDDVRAALDACDDGNEYMEMATNLFWVWMQQSPHEGFRRLCDAFDRLPEPPPALVARAGRVLMACSGQAGDYSMYEAIVPRALAAAEAAGVATERGHHALQLGFHRERLGGDLVGAREAFRDARAVFETESPGPDLVLVTQALGSIERQLGNLDEAGRLITQALDLGRRIDDPYGTIGAYFHRGWLELDKADDAAARASFAAGLELADGTDRLSVAHQLEGLACALAGSDPRRAAQLLGGAEHLREQLFARRQRPWQPRVERAMTNIRDALGEQLWKREHGAGRALPLDLLMQTALERSGDRRVAGGLSRRELEVAQLVAAGMTNRAIADKLFLAERTVESHLDHILTKLDFSSRAQLAAWVASRQL
jgi:non-specific serine/threonine protein kinase